MAPVACSCRADAQLAQNGCRRLSIKPAPAPRLGGGAPRLGCVVPKTGVFARGRPTRVSSPLHDESIKSMDEFEPPYARLSVPVWSLSTNGTSCSEGSSGCDPNGSEEDDTRDSMNIVTYFTPVAINPERAAVIGLYRHTVSWRNMGFHQRGVLQLLGPQHDRAVHLLGKTSANDVDKIDALEDLGYKVTQWEGHRVLSDALAYMLVEYLLPPASDVIRAGDHDVAVCRIVKWQTNEEPTKALYTGKLREEGYL
ncbi:unnamed protein product [Pedinophyceae sp. YPF-701]|nr:unnamed protein product [Pedinophyceae sp. YPF-701]